MAELVALVNSAESVSAAVQNGADAVCVRISSPVSHGLSAEEFYGAGEFCRVRGVKIYADVDGFVSDESLSGTVAAIKNAWLSGADGIRVSDIGLVLSLRRALPDTPIHLSGKMNIHSPDGVRIAEAMGVSRVALSPELPASEIKNILIDASVEIELLTHGFLCPSYGGQCYLGAFSGDGSGRGQCSRECLSEYNTGTRNIYPFSMKDCCLAGYIEELSKVSAFLIDGTDRRPEYIAVLTSLYSRALQIGKLPSDDELNLLQSIQPVGLTDGYISGKKNDMFSPVSPLPDDSSPFLTAIRRGYLRREFQRVTVTFSAEVELGGPLRLAVQDDLGNIAVGEGGKSELAFHRELTQTMLQTELFKTAGTPFLCQNVRCKIQKGISLSQQDIAYVRDKVLAELMEKRKALSARSTGDFTVFPKIDNSPELPVLTVSVLHADQLSQQLLELAPPVVYVPLEEIYGNEDKIRQFTNTPGISVCAVLPCTIYEGETEEVKDMLVKAKSMGVTDVLVENIGHIMFVRQMGFNVRGGSGLNALSSGSLVALRSFKLSSVTLSTELSREEISKISKYVPSELVVYGRLPLMVTDNCIVRNITGTCSCDSFSGIADSTGMIMPLIKSHDCRNTLYSSKKLFLGRMSGEYMNSGLWGVRLAFTTENPRECAAITERFLGMGTFEPTAYTRGNF